MRNQDEVDAMQDRVDDICDEHAGNPVLSAIQGTLSWVRDCGQAESTLTDHLDSQLRYEQSLRSQDSELYGLL